MSRAACSFTVRYVGIFLRVRVYDSAEEVQAAFCLATKTRLQNIRKTARPLSFFCATKSFETKHWGVVGLLRGPRLVEFTAHEVTHAVYHYFEGCIADDDEEEELALAIGSLTGKILKKLDALGIL